MVYDVNSRTLILNDEGRAALSSRTGLIENDDGSVTMHFSPELPDGVEKTNWIQTNPKESWFSYLRFYGPTQAYFDQTYPLQDIMLVNKRLHEKAPPRGCYQKCYSGREISLSCYINVFRQSNSTIRR